MDDEWAVIFILYATVYFCYLCVYRCVIQLMSWITNLVYKRIYIASDYENHLKESTVKALNVKALKQNLHSMFCRWVWASFHKWSALLKRMAFIKTSHLARLMGLSLTNPELFSTRLPADVNQLQRLYIKYFWWHNCVWYVGGVGWTRLNTAHVIKS